MMTFWLGAHDPHWLGRTNIPLFVSHRRLLRMKRRLPRACGAWALDSGGFSELRLFGEWRTTPRDYVAAVRRYQQEIGQMAWAAPQDWMCEPFMLARTGKTLAEHQRLTVENLVTLRDLAPELPIIPVLQGWAASDYLNHVEQYDAAGINLGNEPIVGIGSVCRRQRAADGIEIIHRLWSCNLRLHGFGFKLSGLRQAADWLLSADSMAWSFNARRQGRRLPDCTHRQCASCLRFALHWREGVLRAIQTPKQGRLELWPQA